MGAVYKAVDVSLGRVVALKVLASRLLAHPGALERFRREARNAARLNHPNIVALYEWDKVEDSYYLAMEFVDGPDLSDYIVSKGKLEVAEARAIPLGHAGPRPCVPPGRRPPRHQAVQLLLARQHGELVVKMTDLGLSRTSPTRTPRHPDGTTRR